MRTTNEQLQIDTWEEETRVNHNYEAIKSYLLWFVVFGVLSIIIFFPSVVRADDFEATKQEVIRKVAGTGATVSERTFPKLSGDDIAKINQAREQLRNI